MRLRKQSWLSLRALFPVCAVLSLASLGGGLLQVSSHTINRDQPLSRREIAAYGIPNDAIATRGQGFSLKLCKGRRAQLDQAMAGNASNVVLPVARIAPVSTLFNRLSYAPDALPIGRAPPPLA